LLVRVLFLLPGPLLLSLLIGHPDRLKLPDCP
jgi:hypothetical protein